RVIVQSGWFAPLNLLPIFVPIGLASATVSHTIAQVDLTYTRSGRIASVAPPDARCLMSCSLSPRNLAAALFAFLLSATPSFAQTYTWSGGSGFSDGWFDGLNWVGGSNPLDSTTNTFVVLTGNTQTTNTLDYDFGTNKLTFDAGAGAFTVNGTNTL